MTDWLTAVPDGLRIRVKVTPRASRSEVRGVQTDAAGDAHLAVRVQAPPDRGRANAELLRVLGRELGLAAGRLSLVRGHAGRHKVLHLDQAAPALVARLRELEHGKVR